MPPGGPSGSVQYNNAGAFGGDAGLTFDPTNDIVTVTGAFPRYRLSESGVAANQGNWQIQANASIFEIQAFDDAWSGFSPVIGATRTGVSIDLVTLNVGSNSLALDSNGVLMNCINEGAIIVSNGTGFAQIDLDTTDPLGGSCSIDADYQMAISSPRLRLLGAVAFKQSAAAPAIATGGTIDTTDVNGARLAPAAAVTGIIIEPGILPCQKLTVINQSANTITMAASGTSNVANGVACVIAGLTAKSFTWNSVTALWYPES